MSESLTFITGNPNKAEQFAKYLSMEVEYQGLDLPEIQSLNLEEIVEFKARSAFEQIGSPVLVEDAGLIFHALGRLPGPYIKWFLSEVGNEGMCRMLDNFDDRSATTRVVYGLYDGKTMDFFDGQTHGSIANHPKGDSGFGYDPIFIPDGYTQTRAQMDEADFTATSHRAMAIKKLERALKR